MKLTQVNVIIDKEIWNLVLRRAGSQILLEGTQLSAKVPE